MMNIAELKSLPGWLVWKREGGRKVPYYASGGRRIGRQGAPGDRAGLVPYRDAKAATAHGYDGVGLAMLDWGVVALDLDNVQDWDEARRLVAGTYAEVSPSGKGVRALFEGSMPNSKQPGFEVFCRSGFVTITENVLDEGWDLVSGGELLGVTEEIKALADRRQAVERRRCGTNGAAPIGFDEAAIAAALKAIDPGCGYDDWIRAGMAVHHETGGEGFETWHEWSADGANYVSEEDCQNHWDSFGQRVNGEVVTLRSLLKMAGERGAAIGILGTPAAKVDDFDDLVVPENIPAGVAAGEFPPGLQIDPKSMLASCTVANVKAALRHPPYIGWHIGYDEFLRHTMMSKDGKAWRRLEEQDPTNLREIMGRRKFKGEPRRDLTTEAIYAVAKEHAFDSAKQWLEGLPAWDGVKRVDTFMVNYWGCKDRPYVQALGRYIWSALAGRILEPGCKADLMPIFSGPQGCGKSTGVEAMAPDGAFAKLHLNDRELVRKVQGILVGEIDELRGLHTKELGEIKSFITTQVDVDRAPYMRGKEWHPRRCVLFGTTNEGNFLEDETGNRRFLPIAVGTVDAVGIIHDRGQLWAEARQGYKGVQYREVADLVESEHAAFEAVDAILERLEDWLEEPDIDGDPNSRRAVLQTATILQGLGLRPVKMDETRVSRAMRKMGWVYKVKWVSGKAVKSWARTGQK